MLRFMVRTAAGSLLLAAVCVGQTSAPRELPPAPSTQIAAVRSTAIPQWARTEPHDSYVPLTSRQKLDVFVKRTYSPRTFVGAAFDAGVSQATNGHEEYGRGWNGYGKRYGASLADSESGVFFQHYLLPTLFHQDPRYYRRPDLPTTKRAAYAMSRVLLTRQDDGQTGINVSYLGGGLLASALANAYYPFHERGVGNTVQRFASGILSDAGLNVGYEFWPSIKRRLLRTHLGQRLEHSRLGSKVVPPPLTTHEE
jgi:hypothetical protein